MCDQKKLFEQKYVINRKFNSEIERKEYYVYGWVISGDLDYGIKIINKNDR